MPDDDLFEADLEVPEVHLEITDTLDLHSFPPAQIANLVRDYLDLAAERGFHAVRIIHGKGIGVQRRTVHSLLDRDPRVVAYRDAPDASGWGATVVTLRSRDRDRG